MTPGLQPKQLLSYLFIIAIAVVFILQFGPGSRGCEAPLRPTTTASAALVNGKEISLRDFNSEYNLRMQWFRAQGNNIPDSVARQLGLPRQVLDQMVGTELLAQEAEREGVVASDAELREVIHKNPDFQRDEKFDPQRYDTVLHDYYQKTKAQYESQLRRRMSAAKLLELVASGASVSEDEVKAKFFRDADKASLTFVRFTPTQFADQISAPKDSELKAYAQAHAKEISDSYESNSFLYQKPEEVRARHILIKLDKDTPPQRKEEAKKKLEEIRKEIEAGKDFAQAAKESSEDLGSKEAGGDLGFNPRAAWVPAFAAVAFSLKPGELSQPVETQFGYHLIKVEEKRPAARKELKEVEMDIARQLYTREKSKELAQREAEKALAAARSGKSLKELYPQTDAQKNDAQKGLAKPPLPRNRPTAAETGSFSVASETIPSIGGAPELLADVADLDKPQLLPKLYLAGDAWIVAFATERKRPSESEFTTEKDSLEAEAVRVKQNDLREAFVKALKKNATIVTNQELVGRTPDAS